jgi:hypothetical protein
MSGTLDRNTKGVDRFKFRRHAHYRSFDVKGYRGHIWMVVGDDGRFECHGIEIEADQALVATDLRQIPLGGVIESTIPTPTPQVTPTRKRRVPVGDDLLRDVTRVYREAYMAGSAAPSRRVAEAYSVPYNTAIKWVSKARELGYLPKTEHRKAKA